MRAVLLLSLIFLNNLSVVGIGVPDSNRNRKLLEAEAQLNLQPKKEYELFAQYRQFAMEQSKAEDWSNAIKNGFRALTIFNQYHWEGVNLDPVHNVLSNSLEKIGAYSDAIYHQKVVLDLRGPNDNRYRANYFLMERIGTLYKEIRNYDSALYFFERGRKYAVLREQKELIGHAFNNIGLILFEKQKKQDARKSYEKALNYYLQLDTTQERISYMIAVIKGNLALCLPSSDPRKAGYFLTDIANSLAYEDYSNVLNSYGHYAAMLLELGKLSEAHNILRKAEELIQREVIGLNSKIAFYDVLTRYYARTKDEKNVLLSHKKQMALITERFGLIAINERMKEHSNYELNRIENELQLEKFAGDKKQAEIRALNNKNELTKFRWITTSIISALLVLLALVLIYKLRGDIRKKAQEKLLLKQIHQIQQDIKTERLQKSALSLARKKEFSERLMKQINSIENIRVTERNAIRLTLLNEMEIDGSVIEEEKQIQEVGEEFITQIKIHFPQLNEGDVKLLSLIKMKLSNKQIAEIRNINLTSVKKAKNRLRKKMNMPVGDDFVDYLNF